MPREKRRKSEEDGWMRDTCCPKRDYKFSISDDRGRIGRRREGRSNDGTGHSRVLCWPLSAYGDMAFA